MFLSFIHYQVFGFKGKFAFGEHLTIDGYGGNKELLDNTDLVFEILNNLPGKLGMGILMGPQVVHAPSNDKKDPGGWTGFVVIAESHMSIHPFLCGVLSASISIHVRTVWTQILY